MLSTPKYVLVVLHQKRGDDHKPPAPPKYVLVVLHQKRGDDHKPPAPPVICVGHRRRYGSIFRPYFALRLLVLHVCYTDWLQVYEVLLQGAAGDPHTINTKYE
jgi:hypothetical protein